MSAIVRTHLILLLSLALVTPVFADNDPTLHQVYETASTGHLEQAQQMMNKVLRDHPQSAKAHYVAAELYAKQGHSSLALEQLNTAESLAPGLPFAKRGAVQALQREVSQGQPLRGAPVPASFHTAFPWVAVVLVLSAVGILLFIFRRRESPSVFRSQYPSGVPNVPNVATPTPGNVGGAGIAPNVGGGIGSGIAGGLASGLAVGAGVVAGEEIAHHLLDPNRPEGSAPPANAPVENPSVDPPNNGDMGGSDFGVPDDDSWDDDSGSVGGDVGGGDDGGGDDWS